VANQAIHPGDAERMRDGNPWAGLDRWDDDDDADAAEPDSTVYPRPKPLTSGEWPDAHDRCRARRIRLGLYRDE
jgi:hypothetical protein